MGTGDSDFGNSVDTVEVYDGGFGDRKDTAGIRDSDLGTVEMQPLNGAMSQLFGGQRGPSREV